MVRATVSISRGTGGSLSFSFVPATKPPKRATSLAPSATGGSIRMPTVPYRDQLLLQRLKKKKLRIKDTIERLKDDLIPDLNA